MPLTCQKISLRWLIWILSVTGAGVEARASHVPEGLATWTVNLLGFRYRHRRDALATHLLEGLTTFVANLGTAFVADTAVEVLASHFPESLTTSTSRRMHACVHARLRVACMHTWLHACTHACAWHACTPFVVNASECRYTEISPS